MHSTDVLLFFAKDSASIPLYESVAEALWALDPAIILDVQKTQLTFRKKLVVACLWLPPRRWKAGSPAGLVLTFVLPDPITSSLIQAAVETHHRRWTHHVLLRHPQDVDPQVKQWLKDAYGFSLR